jgi:hypothetical protein
VSALKPAKGNYLGKISDYMGPSRVNLRQNIKHEGFDIVVKGFVIQKELGQQAYILAIELARSVLTTEIRWH